MKKMVLMTTVLIIFAAIVGYYFMASENQFFDRQSTQLLINSLPYYVDKAGWRLKLEGNTDGQKSLSFEQQDKDTLKHVIFFNR